MQQGAYSFSCNTTVNLRLKKDGEVGDKKMLGINRGIEYLFLQWHQNHQRFRAHSKDRVIGGSTYKNRLYEKR
jgi:hypothetical protein